MTARRSATLRLWDGIRMRRCLAAQDPDAAPRAVTLPAAWNDPAAAGLAELAPSNDAVELAVLADPWLAALADRGGLRLATQAQHLLLTQVAAPCAAAWGRAGAPAGFRLNLAAVADAGSLPLAAEFLLRSASVLWPGRAVRAQVTGLAGWLAARGLDYDSASGRQAAAGLLGELRALMPGAAICVAAPDAIDALLGVEAAGLAPEFGPLDAAGALSRSSHALLAARGMSPEAALAAILSGLDLLPTASAASYSEMQAVLAPLLDDAALPPALTAPASRPAQRRELPARRGGIAHKAAVGGQRVYLRTGEYADGTPGEITISMPQASPTVRALIECLSHAIGIGLQHGAPLAEFVDALAGTSFGAAGTVEGDPAVPRAASVVDYAMRHLAHVYLPGMALAPVEDTGRDDPPLLPLDLPRDAAPRRRGLRVVK